MHHILISEEEIISIYREREILKPMYMVLVHGENEKFLYWVLLIELYEF